MSKKYYATSPVMNGKKDKAGKLITFHPGDLIDCDAKTGEKLKSDGHATTDERRAAKLKHEREEAAKHAPEDDVTETEEDEDESMPDEAPSTPDDEDETPPTDASTDKPKAKKPTKKGKK